MTEILIPSVRTGPSVRLFKCPKCGCLFKTDEYQEYLSYEIGGAPQFHVDCPVCSKFANEIKTKEGCLV